VIVLEGAYSAQPSLVDLIDLAVLVDAPAEVRRERLVSREAGDFLAEWHERWDAAEAHYLTEVRPKAFFDLVVRSS
jgi:uridine kinase